MSANERLSHLRDILHGAPTTETWEAALACLAPWDDDSAQVGVDYAAERMASWPAALRTLDAAGFKRACDAATLPTWWSLVREVRAEGVTHSALERLIKLKGLETIEALWLRRATVGVHTLEKLGKSRQLRSLRALGLPWSSLEVEHARALGASKHLVGLEVLALEMNSLLSAGTSALIKNPALANLRRLDWPTTTSASRGRGPSPRPDTWGSSRRCRSPAATGARRRSTPTCSWRCWARRR